MIRPTQSAAKQQARRSPEAKQPLNPEWHRFNLQSRGLLTERALPPDPLTKARRRNYHDEALGLTGALAGLRVRPRSGLQLWSLQPKPNSKKQLVAPALGLV